MIRKRKIDKISNPDELDRYLVSTKPITWIAIVSVILALSGFFVWSFLARITFKITGTAHISSGAVTLNIEEKKLPELKVGQKVYIASLEGEILSINEDGYPTISTFTLADGDYDYYIVTRVTRPIDYFTSK